MSKLVQHSVPKTIIKMAKPMLVGTFAINMYNLINTWFVSQLGTEALAALSFAFPVIMLLMFLSRGIGSGAMTLVAHALGSHKKSKAATLTTHAIVLTACFAALITIIGILTIRPVFAKLGATGMTLELTCRYMRICYWGTIIMALELVISDIIIAAGNTKAVSFIMAASTVVNVFLDIGFIFGRFGMPQMGISGAALATLVSETAALAAAGSILVFKMKLIDTETFSISEFFVSCKKILIFSIPSALGMILTPVASAVITRLVSDYGSAAVAAMGVASRIEMFAFMIPMTVGISLIPFIAQNYGAGRVGRIKQARKITMTFAFFYGIFIAFVFIVFARDMATFFSTEQAVIEILCSYIYITCMGYGFLEIHRYAGFILTGLHEPIHSSALNIIRAAVLLIPLSIAGRLFLGLPGIFWGRLTTDIAAGLLGIYWSGKIVASKDMRS